MGISTIGDLSQGIGYNVKVRDQYDTKVDQYEQTLNQLNQTLKRTNKDAGLSEEEKQQKLQEIQNDIAETKRLKRQAELEEQKDQTSDNRDMIKDQSEEEKTGNQQKTDSVSRDSEANLEQNESREPAEHLLSSGQVESLLIGDHAWEQAKNQQSTVHELENRIRVLGGEIDMDQSRGGDVSAKKAERNELELRVNQVRESAGKRLGSEQRKAEEKRNEEQQQNMNYRFIQSQKDTALPNFQISI